MSAFEITNNEPPRKRSMTDLTKLGIKQLCLRLWASEGETTTETFDAVVAELKRRCDPATAVVKCGCWIGGNGKTRSSTERKLCPVHGNAPDPPRPELAAMIAAARAAVDSFRDFARLHGQSMSFKERDRLVMAIHKAIDVADISFVPPAPADAGADDVRNAALEEAAKLADATGEVRPIGIPLSKWRTEMGDGYDQAATAIAASIRLLKSPPHPGGTPEYARPMGAHTNVDIWPEGSR